MVTSKKNMSSFFWEQIFLPDLFTVVGLAGKICLAHWSLLINIYLETRWLSITQLELLFIFQLWNYMLGNACCLQKVTVASPITQTQWEFTTQLSPHRGWKDLRAASQWCSWSPSSAFLLEKAIAWEPCINPLHSPVPPIITTLHGLPQSIQLHLTSRCSTVINEAQKLPKEGHPSIMSSPPAATPGWPTTTLLSTPAGPPAHPHSPKEQFWLLHLCSRQQAQCPVKDGGRPRWGPQEGRRAGSGGLLAPGRFRGHSLHSYYFPSTSHSFLSPHS